MRAELLSQKEAEDLDYILNCDVEIVTPEWDKNDYALLSSLFDDGYMISRQSPRESFYLIDDKKPYVLEYSHKKDYTKKE